jgi:hypothetical protein
MNIIRSVQLLRMSSLSHQASHAKSSSLPPLDTSSSLLLFSSAADIAGAVFDGREDLRQGLATAPASALHQQPCEPLSALIGRVSSALELQSSASTCNGVRGGDSNESAAAAGLEAAFIVMYNSLLDSQREKTIAGLTHSMVCVLIQAACSSHGLLLLQRCALMTLAGISMSASGRRLVLNESHPVVPGLIDVLTAGEMHCAALAALVLGNLALEPTALAALEQSAVVFAREIVVLISSEQARIALLLLLIFTARTLTFDARYRSISFDLQLAQCGTWQ